MKITKAKAKLLEDVAIALKPIIHQTMKDSREGNIVLAPYSTNFYSFGYLSGWYVASCDRCKKNQKDFTGNEENETKHHFLYKETFEKYMLAMNVSVEKTYELSKHLRKYSQENQAETLNEAGKKLLKNHVQMVAHLIQDHYIKLFAKYDHFDDQGIPLAINVMQDESESMDGFILKERDITL